MNRSDPAPRRDTQRARVYDAEQLVRGAFDRAEEFGHRTVDIYGSQVTLPVERRFASVESVQSYVDKVLALNWVRAQWDRSAISVRVRIRAGTGAAHYERSDAVLAVPLHTGATAWALRELVVLHELAHHLAPSPDEAPHGPEFCTRYAELTDGVIGPEAALLIRATFAGCGVRFG
ncbi:TIGR04338 family metallohydrolase [Nocardia caishijiensis]|uniref:Metallohydrolase (TIGR04338 family) n=1 Tax=Nocardia caishijiensis TaxID=184756 RepID=A0ABQ6YUK2_9NOCA|nr:TIGR04338 family metallohydrolase [Nocardia caishijiensis]KAF0849381.1 putative metallohydrolase (TIGR04338 family) [Nocardia caishijiensis]